MKENSFERLQKILSLEKKQGCPNKIIIGGLDSFVPRWVAKAKMEAAGHPRIIEGVEHIGSLLQSYNQSDPATRLGQIEKALYHLSQVWPGREGDYQSSIGPLAGAKPSSPPPITVSPTEAQSYPSYNRLPRPLKTPSLLTKRLARLDLTSPITTIWGISAGRASRLSKLGINTVEDLLYHFPRCHLDYSAMKSIKDLSLGEQQSILGTIWEARAEPARSGMLKIMATVSDDTGVVEAIWFNQRHLLKYLRTGQPIVLSGEVKAYKGRLQFESPDWEIPEAEDLTHAGRLVPVYPLTEGLHIRWLRSLIKQVLDATLPKVKDHLPADLRQTMRLIDLQTAIAQMHFPDNKMLLQAAQQRLAFDELFLIQLGVLQRRQHWQMDQLGNAMPISEEERNLLLQSLPFKLTAAQERVLQELLNDLSQPRPMIRLLQGEVGSGKTVVATVAIIISWINGFQSVLMVPTEILAEQHYRTISALVDRIAPSLVKEKGPLIDGQLQVRLLTGSLRKSEKESLYRQIADGEIDIIIGTHALIQEGVEFKRLGLVIVDEQHRFGVMQRAALRQKGYNPHLLVMTATPIPRTLAMTLYGDLDISVIDELPPGRQQILTYFFPKKERLRAYNFVREQVRQGRQSFIICPLIEESEKIEAKAATAEYERLKTHVFPDLRLGLLHGKMKAQDKETVMSQFQRQELDILVSTAVVEVGIDIPNATVMLIEGADRFGLAQLHQFRGRVGRGTEKSYCLLLSESISPEAEQRLRIITQTQDGFLLAEEDLKMRGPGEFFGTKQSGMPDLKIARLSDIALLEQARSAATDLFQQDLRLSRYPALAEKVAAFWHGTNEFS
ncbi:MAG: ATP-dependent DNA helicase RecG [Chloroflexi bacterium]|nr:ATP-dependent DNA helicase RecG [Chloroflexota bacterium]MCL5074109.1 ATP-dependent DNA helicase RecG [Chloroflexota bacterium]